MSTDTIELSFTLNGEPVTIATSPRRSVLHLLRQDFGITTLKSACSPQGVCGACAVMINGKSRITCTLRASTLQGKQVVTHAGIDDVEADIYAEAFVRAGGVQCGYCTPGIVMATKSLLDKNPDPSREDIGKALQPHVCRCTGWVKIYDAIELAARMRRGETVPDPAPESGIGASWRKGDMRDLVLGRRPFIGDMKRPDMLYAAIVWTPFARCRVDTVDTTIAEGMPGVHAVGTARDIEGDRKVGLIFRDWRVLVAEGEETRCVADMLAVVAAETPEQAQAAAAAVRVEVEELTPLTDVELAATMPEQVLATCRVDKGDVDAALAECEHVVSETFWTQRIDQAFLEPEGTLVVPDDQGGVTVYASSQGVFDDHKQLCALFKLPADKVRVVLVPTGGGFGGKEDLSVQAQAMLLARMTGRPVKLTVSMEESARLHAKRHGMRLRYTVGCDAQGKLKALRAHIIGDTGGYASVGDKVLERAAGHAAGPYLVPNVQVEALTVYTNNPVAGAMRGFGVNQSAFAFEGCLDRLAQKLDMDPFQLRMQNLLEPGDLWATGQVMNAGCSIKQTLAALKPHYDAAKAAGKHVGVACGIKNVGMGNGIEEFGRCELRVLSDHEVRLYTGFTEMGQGHHTVMAQMVSEASGLSADTFTAETSTRAMVETGMTTASRATFLGGNAAKLAGEALKKALDGVGGDLGRLVDRSFKGEWAAPPTDKPGEEQAIMARGDNPVTHYAFGYASQLAIVDQDGALEEIVAAHDVGRAINRVSCEGQVEGGVFMGIGYALSEEYQVDDQGVPLGKYGKLGIIKARYMPKVTTILVEEADPHGPWGAKGIGEIGLVPTAPAIAAAIHSFDGVWRNRLPMRDTLAARSVGVRVKRPVK